MSWTADFGPGRQGSLGGQAEAAKLQVRGGEEDRGATGVSRSRAGRESDRAGGEGVNSRRIKRLKTAGTLLGLLEGRISRNLGDLPAAESIFLRLQDEFQSASYAHELTLLSLLDLAEVYVAQEMHEAAQRLIRGLLPRLQSWGMHQEGLAVWLLLLESMQRGSARTAAFQQVSEYIHRALA